MNKHIKLLFTLILVSTSFLSFSAIHNVDVSGNVFTPSVLNIEAGDTVQFTNTGGFHNVSADDGSFRCSDSCESSPGDGSGDPSSSAWVAEITFNSVGSFDYSCEIHAGSGMTGVINVVAPTTTVHQVVITGNTFTPIDLTIEAGDIVNFIKDSGFHNIRADDDSFECSEGCLGNGMNLTSEPTSSNWSVYLAFENVADVPYYCEQHGNPGGVGMSGIIRVNEADDIFINGFE